MSHTPVSSRRGLAVAALLACAALPCVKAATIVQSATFNLNSVGFGQLAGTSSWWHHEPPAPGFSKVVFNLTLHSDVSTSEGHEWATPLGPLPPQPYTPSIDVDTSFWFAGVDLGGFGETLPRLTSSGEPVILNFHQHHTFSDSFDQSFSHTFTGATELAHFASAHDILFQSRAGGFTRFGRNSVDADWALSLTYHYVPDGGSTVLLLGLVCAGYFAKRAMRAPMSPTAPRI